MSVLVVAEHDNAALDSATLRAITAARVLGSVTVLVVGHRCRGVAANVARVEGVERVLLADGEAGAHPLAETVAPVVVEAASGHDHLLAAATTTGKNLMPRVAAMLDVAQISEVVAVEGLETFERPIYAGNALARVRSRDRVKALTVRPTAFEPAESGAVSAPIEDISAPEGQGLARFVRMDRTASDRPELTSARIVIAAGRGVGGPEGMKLVERVADTLGAAVGASRAAVDAGFAPNDYQVGQTGKVVAPDLYIAVGISGAIQHLAGMKDSKIIVAINKDEEAPIFQVADYGLVGDLFKALPEFAAELEERLLVTSNMGAKHVEEG